MRKALIPLSLLLFLSFVSVAYADSGEVNVLDIPTNLGNMLGVGAFIGGLIASMFILMLTIGPCLIMAAKNHMLLNIVGIGTLALLVGLGWFPLYVFIIIILAIALGAGESITDKLGGRLKR